MKLGFKAVLLSTVAAAVALATVSCAAQPVVPQTITPMVTVTYEVMTTPDEVTVVVTPAPFTVTTSVTATVAKTATPIATSVLVPASSITSATSDAPPEIDKNGNLMVEINPPAPNSGHDPLIDCTSILSTVESIGGRLGGCEFFDQDTWNEIVTHDPNGFNLFNQAPFWHTDLTMKERLYVGLTACEELSVSQGGGDLTRDMVAIRSMEPIIVKWFHGRVSQDVMKAALSEAEVSLCPAPGPR